MKTIAAVPLPSLLLATLAALDHKLLHFGGGAGIALGYSLEANHAH